MWASMTVPLGARSEKGCQWPGGVEFCVWSTWWVVVGMGLVVRVIGVLGSHPEVARSAPLNYPSASPSSLEEIAHLPLLLGVLVIVHVYKPVWIEKGVLRGVVERYVPRKESGKTADDGDAGGYGYLGEREAGPMIEVGESIEETEVLGWQACCKSELRTLYLTECACTSLASGRFEGPLCPSVRLGTVGGVSR